MGKINVHQMLKDKFLLIEDDRTIECHTHLVKEVIKEIVESAIDLCAEEAEINGATHDELGQTLVSIDKNSILAVKKMINYE